LLLWPFLSASYVLEKRIDGLSDITEKVGLGSVTPARILGLLGYTQVDTFAQAVLAMDAFTLPANAGLIDLGSFRLKVTPDGLSSLVETHPLDILSQVGGPVADGLRQLEALGGVYFAALHDAVSFFQVVTTTNVKLFEYNLVLPEFHYHQTQDLGRGDIIPGIIWATVSAGWDFDLSASLQLSCWSGGLVSGDFGSAIMASASFRADMGVRLSLSANVGIGIIKIASADLGGGLSGHFTASLAPTPASVLLSGSATFNVGGSITADIIGTYSYWAPTWRDWSHEEQKTWFEAHIPLLSF
jgi:hypothetical protein